MNLCIVFKRIIKFVNNIDTEDVRVQANFCNLNGHTPICANDCKGERHAFWETRRILEKCSQLASGLWIRFKAAMMCGHLFCMWCLFLFFASGVGKTILEIEPLKRCLALR